MYLQAPHARCWSQGTSIPHQHHRWRKSAGERHEHALLQLVPARCWQVVVLLMWIQAAVWSVLLHRQGGSELAASLKGVGKDRLLKGEWTIRYQTTVYPFGQGGRAEVTARAA